MNRIGFSINRTFNYPTSLSIHLYDRMLHLVFIGFRLKRYYYTPKEYDYCVIQSNTFHCGTFIGWTRPVKDKDYEQMS